MSYNVKNAEELVRTNVPTDEVDLRAVDPGDADIYGQIILQSNNVYLAANNDDLGIYSGITCDLSNGFGQTTIDGTLSLNKYTYSADFSTLEPGWSQFLVTFEPTTDVTVTVGENGSIWMLENDCGAAFNLVADSTETFNGASSFTILDGQTYLFIAVNGDKLLVLSQGSAGGSFAGLSDLTTAVVPTVDLKADVAFNIGSFDPSEAELLAAFFSDTDGTSIGQCGFYANGTNSDANAEFFAYGDLNTNVGQLFEKGAKKITVKTYTGATSVLEAAHSMHNFTADPAGNVAVHYVNNGNMFQVQNNSGVAITLVADTAETFNGQSSITITNTRGYNFSSVTANEYIVTSTGPEIIYNDGAGKLAGMYVDPTAQYMGIYTEAPGDLYAGLDLTCTNGWGEIASSGSFNPQQMAYLVDFTELSTGYMKHYVNFEPSGDVTVPSSGMGSLWWLQNNSGAAFDLIPEGAETFNGASTFTVNNNTTYLFIDANSGQYKVL